MAHVPNEAAQPEDDEVLEFLRSIVARDRRQAIERALQSSGRLAVSAIQVGGTRQNAETYFLTDIRHYVYRGDTGLHIVAAAYDRKTAELLVARGANVGARNRRGAEPIHYAADGSPGGARWDPGAQASIIEYLIANGADPNAVDNSGVAALHRAVRTRSTGAVRALLDHGAEPRLPNKTGSTPLHLAVQNTGRSNSGADAAKREQRLVIGLLLQHGASANDKDAKGKTVEAAATSDWIRELLDAG